ncbi:MAG: LytTR family transcriptional regulator, partial [Leptospiraceae bacterium]|nr:LytTR family transcriptional regulator [Leptospiraceae bacterium]
QFKKSYVGVSTYFMWCHTKYHMSEKQNKPPGFSLKEKENHYLIPYKEILYISSHSRTSVVHTKSRDYAVNLLLKEIENKLPSEQFIRIHKSFIINFPKISHIQYFMGGSYIAFLRDDDETNLPVGRKYAPILKFKMGIETNHEITP